MLNAVNQFWNSIMIFFLIRLGKRLVLLSAFVLAGHALFSQSLAIIRGTVTDGATGKSLPFVNIYFKGTSVGTITDKNGHYHLRTTQEYDSIVASFIGYKTQVKRFLKGVNQTIDFALDPDLINLKEVVVMSGENPAWAIIRNAVKRKSMYNRESLRAYEYTSYNRIEMYFDDISDRLNRKKVFKQIWTDIDSSQLSKDPEGRAMLPVFISESLSRFYVKNNPYATREEVIKTKIQGLAIEDGSLTSQFVGASYQQYNFYNNWLDILSKRFMSPIADGWKAFYDYEILDTLNVGNDNCYKLKVIPKHPQDLAFEGTIWITVGNYALKKLDLHIGKRANINFVEGLYLTQTLGRTTEGPWLPVETDVTVDVGQLTFNTTGMLIRFHNYTSGWVLNHPREDKFYKNEVIVDEDATLQQPESYWDTVRPRPLTEEQIRVYGIVEDIKKVPLVNTYVNLIKLLSTGYIKSGKVDYGPHLYAYAFNNFEGSSFRLGLRTNANFSRKIELKGYLGYGTRDKRFKYGFRFTTIFSRQPWMTLSLSSSYDVEQAGLKWEDLQSNYIFFAATRFRTFYRPYYHMNNKIVYKYEIVKGLSPSIGLRNEYFDPRFSYYYHTNPGSPETQLKSDFYNTTFLIGMHWARDETFAINDNERLSLGTRKAPAIDFLYTMGIKNLLGGDFNYKKVDFRLTQQINLGLLGTSNYRIDAGYVFGQIPTLLLENHIGNESVFYTNSAFNTMNYFEFVSDHYASLRFEHYFQGLIFNKIPLLKKLKWRSLVEFNILYGGMRQENIDFMSPVDPEDNPTLPFGYLSNTPYIEIGYGIENIFKILRIDAFNRLTYRNAPGATLFTVKMSFQFKL